MRTIYSVIIGAFILMLEAFRNGFPLVYPDTGTYIRSGFTLEIPVDRPIYYGLFIKVASLNVSLWLVILVQALIVSWIIHKFIELFNLPRQNIHISTLIVIGLLSITTGISFNTSMLTPDILTSIMILTGILILKTKNNIRTSVITGVIFIFSILVHNSHIFIFTFGFLLTVLLNWVFRKYFGRVIFGETKELFKLVILFGFSIILSLSLNYIIGGRMSISEGGHVFLINKLHEDDLLVPFLNESCDSKHWYLCNGKDSLPWDMIWDSKSPVTRNGDWNIHKTENISIILGLLTTPKYLFLFSYKCIVHGLKQLFKFNTGDAPSSHDMLQPPTIEIKNHFEYEFKEFLASNQCLAKQDYSFLNLIQMLCVIFSSMGLLVWLIHHDQSIQSKLLMQFMLLIFPLIVANAFVCANLSIVLDRYASRVIWLIPLMGLTVVIPKVLDKIQKEDYVS